MDSLPPYRGRSLVSPYLLKSKGTYASEMD
jgi:hypothetical protein